MSLNKFFLLLWLLLFIFNNASADEVFLKNGSRIIGTVLKKEDTTLQFKTPFAGTLKIKWDNIIELKTDKAVKIMLNDDSTQMANSFKNKPETIQISDNKAQEEIIKQSDMAYINPDPWRLGEGYKVSGKINFALKIDRGNTIKDEYYLDGALTLRRKDDRLTAKGEYDNERSNNTRTDLNWLLYSQYDYFINDKTYLGGSVFYENDEFADLDLRQTYGLHIGQQYFESKAINLDVEGGIAQVYENFIDSDDGDFFALTWKIDYNQFFFNEFIQLYHRQHGRLNVEDTDKYIFKSWSGLRFPLALGFSVSGEVEADYDNQPASDAHKTDTTYRLKIGYDF